MIQKKSVSGSWILPFVIFDKKVPFLPCQKLCYFEVFLCYFKVFLHKTSQKVPFFEDSGCYPEILNYTLMPLSQLKQKIWQVTLNQLQTKYGLQDIRKARQ